MSKPAMPLPLYKDLVKILRYEPSSGYFYWKVKRNRGLKPGDRAGGLRGQIGKKYWSITVNKKRYQAHRLAWLLFYKKDPGDLFIDHKNGDRLDNRIENLRETTPAQNSQNRKVGKNNKSGCKGVIYCFWKPQKPWEVRIQSNNKSYWLGAYSTKEEAIQKYKAAQIKHHGEFRH